MRSLRWLTGLLICGLTLLGGCSGEEKSTAQPRVGQEVPIFREFRGQQGPFPERRLLVIQRPEAWRALWGTQQAPDVDFSRQSVLVALMGQQPTGGYGITIDDVRATGQQIIAYITEERPQANQPVTQALAFPYHMVVVPKLTQPVVFNIGGALTPIVAIQDEFLGTQSNATAPGTSVIRDPEAWRQFWVSLLGPNAAVPTVDFAQQMAVAVLIGPRTTTGYAVEIISVDQANDRLSVNYRLRSPQAGETVLQQTISPFAVAVIPVSPLPIAFRSTAGTTITATAQE